MTDKQLEAIERDFYSLMNNIDNSYVKSNLATEEKCIKWYRDAYAEIKHEEDLQLSKYRNNKDDEREVYTLANRCRNGIEAKMISDYDRFNSESFYNNLCKLLLENNM